MNQDVTGIILAAGAGTRMKSSVPKVLHTVAGRPILEWVIAAVEPSVDAGLCLVLSSELESFKDFLAAHPKLTVALQMQRRGTGDAVAAAACAFTGAKRAPFFAGELHRGPQLQANHVLICTGDTPALEAEILTDFVAKSKVHNADIAVLGVEYPEPTGYGRLVCDAKGGLEKIVEEKDTDPATRALRLCNSGVIFAKTRVLFQLLAKLEPKNKQNEYYLTDCFAHARVAGLRSYVYSTNSWQGFCGINDREQLAAAERWFSEGQRQN